MCQYWMVLCRTYNIIQCSTTSSQTVASEFTIEAINKCIFVIKYNICLLDKGDGRGCTMKVIIVIFVVKYNNPEI